MVIGIHEKRNWFIPYESVSPFTAAPLKAQQQLLVMLKFLLWKLIVVTDQIC